MRGQEICLLKDKPLNLELQTLSVLLHPAIQDLCNLGLVTLVFLSLSLFIYKILLMLLHSATHQCCCEDYIRTLLLLKLLNQGFSAQGIYQNHIGEVAKLQTLRPHFRAMTSQSLGIRPRH